MELKPCKCGAFEGFMLYVRQWGSNWEVICSNCGDGTDLKPSKKKAIEAWNRRVGEGEKE